MDRDMRTNFRAPRGAPCIGSVVFQHIPGMDESEPGAPCYIEIEYSLTFFPDNFGATKLDLMPS